MRISQTTWSAPAVGWVSRSSVPQASGRQMRNSALLMTQLADVTAALELTATDAS